MDEQPSERTMDEIIAGSAEAARRYMTSSDPQPSEPSETPEMPPDGVGTGTQGRTGKIGAGVSLDSSPQPSEPEPLSDEEMVTLGHDADDINAGAGEQWNHAEKRLILTIDSLTEALKKGWTWEQYQFIRRES